MADADRSIEPRDGAPVAGLSLETSVSFTIEVNAPIEHAFRVFTEGINSWWPHEHHIGRAEIALVILEPRAGGRWYELDVDGSECEWGTVLAWDPPGHLALSWHLDGEFRFDADGATASRVDVHFVERADGTTGVRLEHSGLDRHGPTWRRLRDAITRGWSADLLLFAAAAERPSMEAGS